MQLTRRHAENPIPTYRSGRPIGWSEGSQVPAARVACMSVASCALHEQAKRRATGNGQRVSRGGGHDSARVTVRRLLHDSACSASCELESASLVLREVAARVEKTLQHIFRRHCGSVQRPQNCCQHSLFTCYMCGYQVNEGFLESSCQSRETTNALDHENQEFLLMYIFFATASTITYLKIFRRACKLMRDRFAISAKDTDTRHTTTQVPRARAILRSSHIFGE